MMRPRFGPLVLVVSLLSACGDSGDDAVNTTVAAATTDATTTTSAPATTTTGAPEALSEGSGSGDEVVEFSIESTNVVTFTHDGTEAFTVQELGADLEPIGVLIDTTGPYNGTRPVQWEAPGAGSGGFEISADGNWTYSIFNLDYARHEDCPIEGDGDDVVVVNDLKAAGFETGESHLVDVTFDGDTAFDIWVWGFGPTEQLISNVGPFDDTVAVPDGMAIWDIAANGGAWRIDCGPN